MGYIEWTTELRFVVALVLGFLVGLERESSKREQKKVVLGGIRTYPIISMLGFGSAWLHQVGVSAILPIALISITTLTAISYFAKIQTEKYGFTSEISAILTFIIGALALLVDVWAAMALGVINTMLLSEKALLEDYVDKLDRVEFLAVLKFLLVTMIILPILPNVEYTQFKINPSKVWLIVIIVSTVGFVGYYLSKKLGKKVGFWVSGFVSGIVSSTAVSIAYGRMAKNNEQISINALQGTIAASSVMYLRILVLIFIINPSIVLSVTWQLLLLSAVGFGLSLLKFKIKKSKVKLAEEQEKLQNPFEIRPAVLFAILFVVLIVATGLVKQYFGDSGILTLSAIVGVVDIDPFILSLINSSTIEIKLIASSILLAMLSNTIMKGIYFGYLATTVRKEAFLRFGILTLAHIPIIIITLLI
ncbi:MAG: MgtC/SapB family protein [Ignavibacteria bacterium]|nr:MgtC/SapB family protein [Ignavibacteria bacterium]